MFRTNIHAIYPFTAAIFSLAIGTFVLLKYRKSFVNFSFFLLSLSSFIWQLGTFFILISTKPDLALFWVRFGFIGIALIPITTYQLVISLLLRVEQKRKFVVLGYLISILLWVPLSWTKYFFSGVYIYPWGYWFRAGILHPLFLVTFGSYMIASFYRLFSAYNKEGLPLERMRKKYLLIALIVAYIGAIDYLPTYGVRVYPFGFLAVIICIMIIGYGIYKYRLMDINIALTRAGIFIVVYALVLGIPFWVGFKYGLWKYSTLIMLVLATSGPLIYNYLRSRAEARIQAEERHARDLLTQASEGMMRIRSIKRLVSLMVHVTCKTLKLENAAVFLFDEVSGEYKLEAVRLKSKYRYLQSLGKDDPLIQKLSSLEEPLVYETVKSLAQQLKSKPDDSIHEIESQMSSFSGAVIIPASSRGYLLGFLVLGEKKSNRMYSNEDLSVLWVLSNQAALAIENAQFHKKAQEALLKEDREMTARFIGHGASHQFGNVLNRIIQRSSGRQMDLEELDLNSISSEELKNLVLELKGDFQAITNAGMQGKEIVSGILSLGAGSPVDFKQEDLKTIIQRSVQTVKLKESKAHIQHMSSPPEIVTDVPDALPKIWCNSLQIEQVLDNMLDNGLEAIEEKEFALRSGELKNDGSFRGRVLVKVAVAEERIFLEILDNGIGIKQTDSKNMFTPFFTTKATERLSRKGHGIGMHMVKEIIKAHQGKIYVADTEYGIGTTFMIEFPLNITENKKIQK